MRLIFWAFIATAVGLPGYLSVAGATDSTPAVQQMAAQTAVPPADSSYATHVTSSASGSVVTTPDMSVPAFVTDADGRSFGRMADPAGRTAEEAVAASPDFIAVFNRDGTAVAGFVAKSLMLNPMKLLDGPVPVYNRDGITLAGHWYNILGFVGLGENPADIQATGFESVVPE